VNEQGYKILDIYETQFYPTYDLTLFENLFISFAVMKLASKGKNDGYFFLKKQKKQKKGSSKKLSIYF